MKSKAPCKINRFPLYWTVQFTQLTFALYIKTHSAIDYYFSFARLLYLPRLQSVWIYQILTPTPAWVIPYPLLLLVLTECPISGCRPAEYINLNDCNVWLDLWDWVLSLSLSLETNGRRDNHVYWHQINNRSSVCLDYRSIGNNIHAPLGRDRRLAAGS